MKILKDNIEVKVLDLGEVKIGDTKTYDYTLENDSMWEVKDIELSIEDMDGIPVNEITFIKYPSVLLPKAKQLIQFSWTPSIEIKKGLKTQLQIKAVEIWT